MADGKKRKHGEDEQVLAKRRRARDEQDDPIKELRRLLGRRVSYLRRYQGQVAMQRGPTGLGVLHAKMTGPCGRHCTDLIEPWVFLLSHPSYGLKPYRLTEKQYNAIPLFINKKLWKRLSKVSPSIELERVINSLIAMKKDESLRTEFFSRFMDHYELPDQPVTIEIHHVMAKKGDIVIYRTFHCNASVSDVACVHHLDYYPYEPTEENHAFFRSVYSQRCGASYTVGQGSSNSPVIENEYYTSKKEDRVPSMPKNAYAQAALGARAWDTVNQRSILDALSENDKYTLERAGYIVINPEITFAHTMMLVHNWHFTVEFALKEFEQFFNYALFERVGITDRRLSFADPKDPLWNILRGEKECERLLGDRKFLNLAKKDEDGTWKHAGTAQGGLSNVTKMCGMGLATNFYRGHASLSLSCHPFVVRLYQLLYGTIHVHNCCERWRVKCGTGDERDDLFPRTNMMPLHCDTRPPLFSHSVLDV